jgi:hypothetical protein
VHSAPSKVNGLSILVTDKLAFMKSEGWGSTTTTHPEQTQYSPPLNTPQEETTQTVIAVLLTMQFTSL